jgi:hypothetical protein
MAFVKKILRSNFFIKLKSWEYWPFGIVQLPLFFYFAWLSLRSRSITFFSASNPGITMGGMFGESKFEVLQKIPPQYIPSTLLVSQPSSKEGVLTLLKDRELSFPLIFKPEFGERGFMVKRIGSPEDIEQYLAKMKFNFLIQPLVDLPLEFGVFYTRFPDKKQGEVTSVVMKEMLFVEGNGRATLQELILEKDRAKLQWETLKSAYEDRLDEILPAGKRMELVSIGNHCLGTKFLDASYLINERLSSVFDHISKQIEGFYFGRFDLKCESLEALYEGRVVILELNGCGAEPAHIYHPGYPLFKAIGVLIKHWRNIFLIARENTKRGSAYIPLKEAISYYKKFKLVTQPVNQ